MSSELTEVYIPSDRMNFGEVKKADLPSTFFRIKNIGKEHLVVSDVKSACHCTVPSIPKEPVLPGQWMQIEVKYDNHAYGFFQQNVYVYCNAPNSPIELTILGSVVFENDSSLYIIR